MKKEIRFELKLSKMLDDKIGFYSELTNISKSEFIREANLMMLELMDEIHNDLLENISFGIEEEINKINSHIEELRNAKKEIENKKDYEYFDKMINFYKQKRKKYKDMIKKEQIEDTFLNKIIEEYESIYSNEKEENINAYIKGKEEFEKLYKKRFVEKEKEIEYLKNIINNAILKKESKLFSNITDKVNRRKNIAKKVFREQFLIVLKDIDI